jgi:hypothetical protein
MPLRHMSIAFKKGVFNEKYEKYLLENISNVKKCPLKGHWPSKGIGLLWYFLCTCTRTLKVQFFLFFLSMKRAIMTQVT